MRLPKEVVAERETMVLEFFRQNPYAQPEKAFEYIKNKTGMGMSLARIAELKDFTKKEKTIPQAKPIEKVTEKVVEKIVEKVIKVTDHEEVSRLKEIIYEQEERIRALRSLVSGFQKAHSKDKIVIVDVHDIEIADAVIKEYPTR